MEKKNKEYKGFPEFDLSASQFEILLIRPGENTHHLDTRGQIFRRRALTSTSQTATVDSVGSQVPPEAVVASKKQRLPKFPRMGIG